MKDKEVANFATFVLAKLLLFPPQKWMNLISDWLSTESIKYLNWPSPVFGWFKNGCNKVVIEPCVVQFWSEIILVILKPRVWFQPKLHSTQFNYHYLLNCYVISRVLIFTCFLLLRWHPAYSHFSLHSIVTFVSHTYNNNQQYNNNSTLFRHVTFLFSPVIGCNVSISPILSFLL